MFTGLVREVGIVRSIRKTGDSYKIAVSAVGIFSELAIGDSVAVNGACLTVTALDNGVFTADISYETARRTTLGELRAGDYVNLEPALRLTDRLGGHIVSGHVDGVGVLEKKQIRDDSVYLAFSAPSALLRYIVEKGSVCVDGISLTVADRLAAGFSVVVIPHTLSETTLKNCAPGRKVNLECDIIAKYVEALMPSGRGSGLTIERLRELGF
ncbi:riboflavin synthase [Rarispira pelagica]|uniref:riboflavin synthase n=1 Tax=Rarispira pelagica TaxID=3141764 RepID=UPI003B28AB31